MQMTEQPQDPREILAKMAAEEEAARKKAEQLAEQNKAKREAILKQLREDDLAIVKEKCQLHGFTATDLRGALKTKGASTKSTPRKSPSKSKSRKKPT
jgi:hypothetical protein